MLLKTIYFHDLDSDIKYYKVQLKHLEKLKESQMSDANNKNLDGLDGLMS